MILVRSRTDTNMMLAMLKQPTRMANIAMNPPPNARLEKMVSKIPVSMSMRFTEKSSS